VGVGRGAGAVVDGRGPLSADGGGSSGCRWPAVRTAPCRTCHLYPPPPPSHSCPLVRTVVNMGLSPRSGGYPPRLAGGATAAQLRAARCHRYRCCCRRHRGVVNTPAAPFPFQASAVSLKPSPHHPPKHRRSCLFLCYHADLIVAINVSLSKVPDFVTGVVGSPPTTAGVRTARRPRRRE